MFDSVAAPPPIQSTKLDPGDRLSGVPATGPWSISHHAGHEASYVEYVFYFIETEAVVPMGSGTSTSLYREKRKP